ncbi:MAG: hypothetical protein WCY41_02730 [Candidatus Micrarchaeia archaeon]
MAKNQEGSQPPAKPDRAAMAGWALQKAEQYLQSSRYNLGEDHMFVAAEEAFRAIENSLEAMLYLQGVDKIAYPGREKEFTGRMALQFLVRDNLLNRKLITRPDYDKYFSYAAKLHQAGYRYGSFEEKDVEGALEFAEGLFHRATAMKLG